jgi:hypothetical protein
MKPEVKEKVIAAIKSGGYKKCVGQLFSGMSGNKKTMCILGVVDDVYRQEHGKPQRTPGLEDHIPKRGVLEWAGISPWQADDYMTANDESRRNLLQLARLKVEEA